MSIYRDDTEPTKPVAPATLARRRQLAKILCEGATNQASWVIADKQARRFIDDECGCAALGIPQPKESE